MVPQQCHAGKWLVFWITGADPTAAQVAEAECLAAQFGDCDACLIHIAATADVGHVEPPTLDALVQYFDPEGEFPRALGLDGPGTILIDRSHRLHSVTPGGTIEDALETCRAGHARSPAGELCTQAPVLLVANVLETDLCRALIAYWKQGSKMENAVARQAGGNQVPVSQIKRRSDVVVQELALFQSVKQRIERRVLTEVIKAFQFETARMEALRVGCYDAAAHGAFGRHRDNMTPYTAHRKFAMSLNLNSGDYEGGAIAFPEYGRQIYRPAAGEAIVFSCSLVHEAQPVRKGRRFGLFTFFTDRTGAAQEDGMLAMRKGEIVPYTVA